MNTSGAVFLKTDKVMTADGCHNALTKSSVVMNVGESSPIVCGIVLGRRVPSEGLPRKTINRDWRIREAQEKIIREVSRNMLRSLV